MIAAITGLLLAAMALLPFGRSIEIPLGLLAILGITLSVRGEITFRSDAMKLLTALYLAFVIPMLIALPDAVALKKSATTTLGSLRYFFAAVALLHVVGHAQSKQMLDRVLLGGAIVVSIWAADALLQAASGQNILGYGVTRGYINGMFGEDDNLKLPFALVIFYPLLVVWAQRQQGYRGALGVLMVVIVLLAVLFTGKRVAWMTVLVESALLSLFYLRSGQLSPKLLASASAFIVIASIGAYNSSHWVQMRTDNVANAIVHPNYDSINKALSLRLPIWSAAVDVAADNWINGVGPRGFRYVYADYAPADNAFVGHMDSDPRAAKVSHPHQLTLEVLAECGLIGLAGLALLALLLWRHWHGASQAHRELALPFAVSTAGMLFPLNSQGAFYSSWSCQLFWLMLALTIFALYAQSNRNVDSAP